MIPKIIHFCWFGRKEYPSDVKSCIESWKKYCPNFELVLWNEDNFPISDFKFAKLAYEEKKYACVADIARIYALSKMGGVYLDTDVEIIKPIDELLTLDSFIGFEDDKYIAGGIIASKKNGEFVRDILDIYSKLNTFDSRNICPIIYSNYLEEKGVALNGKKQKFENMMIFSPEYFYPKNYHNGILNITNKTYAIHHYDASWIENKTDFLNRQRKSRYLHYFSKAVKNCESRYEFIEEYKKQFNVSNKFLLLYSIKSIIRNILKKL